ncbi:hypothetical protein K9M79_02375 [Candidatus Woesearchaeota archaeon]|nr:hypothetical protein [Candidatus Woesearchaeota archaeon]
MKAFLILGLLVVGLLAGCSDNSASGTADDVQQDNALQPSTQQDTSVDEVESVMNDQMISETDYVEVGEMI